MSNLPQSHSDDLRRPPRIRPAEYTPAVLRVEDGSCTQATLELFSLTGGLLSLPKPLDKGSRPRLMFLTQTGPVLGVAEMLKPVSWTEQPFRFIGLHEDDQNRLQAATGARAKPVVAAKVVEPEPAVETQPETQPKTLAATVVEVPTLDSEDPWIQKYRTALDSSEAPRRRFSSVYAALTAVALAALAYVVQAHLLR